jgi:Ser/Thr protein kinase RdoA (MazF antagonist)
MTRFIQADFPTEHAGITRFTRGFAAVRQLDTTLTHPVLAVLAFIGAPLRQVGAKVASRFAAWSGARKERAEDDKLWAVALTDARVMADLSRAMSAEARSVRSYY